MIRHLYSFVFYLILPLVLLRVYWRAMKEPRYSEDLWQRFGTVHSDQASPVWVHAVSAGETIAAASLIRRLLEAGEQVTISNMTPAGRERAEALFGDHPQVDIVYAPYDFPMGVNRFFTNLAPKALVVIDTELWPNMIEAARARRVPVFLVNGRLSEKSARGYARISLLAGPMFQAIDTVFAQSESQAKRFLELGSVNVITAGSIKFDATLPDDFESRADALAVEFAGHHVLLGASTHEGEESLLLEAYQEFKEPGALLVLAPRHTRRVDDVEKLIRDKGFSVQRYSEGAKLRAGTRVYLVDIMGVLIYFYGVCRSAFVGGSLKDVGGHNPMEPGMLGKPIMMGSYRRNIADIAELFEQAGGLVSVQSSEDISSFWRRTMVDSQRDKHSDAVLAVMNENAGALDRVMNVLLPRLTSEKME